MIFVERSRVPAPPELQAENVRAALSAGRSFFSQPPEQRLQRRFDFARRISMRSMALPLMELFHGKCAFCESPIDRNSLNIENFRPRSGAVGIDGERSPDHYWWLAFDWRNLYPVFIDCNRSKGSRFPVRGNRAPVEVDWSALREENALLLDPCSDNPEEHLVFSADGSVAATHVDDLEEAERRRFGMPTRGQVTIDTFGLNRPSLVTQRSGEAARCIESLEYWASSSSHRVPCGTTPGPTC